LALNECTRYVLDVFYVLPTSPFSKSTLVWNNNQRPNRNTLYKNPSYMEGKDYKYMSKVGKKQIHCLAQ